MSTPAQASRGDQRARGVKLRANRGGSTTVTLSQRIKTKKPVKKPAGKRRPLPGTGLPGKRKRKCELGSNCPYQNEYQHQLEFEHNARVAHNNANDIPAQSQPFAGRGFTLGGGAGSRLGSVNSRYPSASQPVLSNYRSSTTVANGGLIENSEISSIQANPLSKTAILKDSKKENASLSHKRKADSRHGGKKARRGTSNHTVPTHIVPVRSGVSAQATVSHNTLYDAGYHPKRASSHATALDASQNSGIDALADMSRSTTSSDKPIDLIASPKNVEIVDLLDDDDDDIGEEVNENCHQNHSLMTIGGGLQPSNIPPEAGVRDHNRHIRGNTHCPVCQKVVPIENMTLHRLGHQRGH